MTNGGEFAIGNRGGASCVRTCLRCGVESRACRTCPCTVGPLDATRNEFTTPDARLHRAQAVIRVCGNFVVPCSGCFCEVTYFGETYFPGKRSILQTDFCVALFAAGELVLPLIAIKTYLTTLQSVSCLGLPFNRLVLTTRDWGNAEDRAQLLLELIFKSSVWTSSPFNEYFEEIWISLHAQLPYTAIRKPG